MSTDPVFQKRHFERLAQAILKLPVESRLIAIKLVETVNDNPKFNRGKFHRMCGAVTDDGEYRNVGRRPVDIVGEIPGRTPQRGIDSE